MTAEQEQIHHPQRYQSSNGIECCDAIEACCENLAGLEAFMIANVIKYVWRYKKKNGVEDLKKAREYLDQVIAGYEVTNKFNMSHGGGI